MIVHALSVLSVQAQVSTIAFLSRKNQEKSHFGARRAHKTSYFTYLERLLARRDVLDTLKSIEYIYVCFS